MAVSRASRADEMSFPSLDPELDCGIILRLIDSSNRTGDCFLSLPLPPPVSDREHRISSPMGRPSAIVGRLYYFWILFVILYDGD